jgi:hypothetical protein
MPLIPVLKFDRKAAMNPDRPVNALLKAQVRHLHEAERNLPLQHRTDIYINAIKTEGEAAEYIRQVTNAIHDAHAAAAVKRRRGIAIAAAASDAPSDKGQIQKKSTRATKKKTSPKPTDGTKT